MAGLLKRNVFDRDMVHKIINFFIEDFTSRIDVVKISYVIKEISGGAAGKVLFSQLTGVNLGLAISSRAVTVFFFRIYGRHPPFSWCRSIKSNLHLPES